MMPQFASTAEAQAFRTAVEKAITDKDYTAFVAAHTKYGITKYSTETEFNEMITRRANQEKIQTALEAGDYSTWKTLNEGRPILDIIDTEAEFKKLQEMHSYNEKEESTMFQVTESAIENLKEYLKKKRHQLGRPGDHAEQLLRHQPGSWTR